MNPSCHLSSNTAACLGPIASFAYVDFGKSRLARLPPSRPVADADRTTPPKHHQTILHEIHLQPSEYRNQSTQTRVDRILQSIA